MSKAKTVVGCAIRPDLNRQIDVIVEDLGKPYSKSFVLAKLIEAGLEQYLKGDVEL